MKTVVVTDPPRADPGVAGTLGSCGVVTVPRAGVKRAVTSAQARVEKEKTSRAAFAQGELGLDRYGLRGQLGAFGIRYVSFEEYQQDLEPR